MKSDSTALVFGDDISKNIYAWRIKYNNGDFGSFNSILSTVMGGNDMLAFMNRYKDNLYIFGAGIIGQNVCTTWNKGKFRAFIDNDKSKQEKIICSLPVKSLQEVDSTDREIGIVVVNKFHSKEIIEQCVKYGFCKEQLFDVIAYRRPLIHNQYFDLDAVNKNKSITFVDVGCHDGLTSLYAEEWFDHLDRIYAFEPDKANVSKIRKAFSSLSCPCEIITKGAWFESTVLNFNAAGNGTSEVCESGSERIITTTIDEVVEPKENIFIKMDIEGAEYEALTGCKRLIRNYHPVLAISVYHKKDDIMRIPALIRDFSPDYTFWLRHYSFSSYETVLYAT